LRLGQSGIGRLDEQGHYPRVGDQSCNNSSSFGVISTFNWVKLDLWWDRAREVDAWRTQDFADRHDRNVRVSRGHHAYCARGARRDLDVDLSAMPSRGKRSVVSQIPRCSRQS